MFQKLIRLVPVIVFLLGIPASGTTFELESGILLRVFHRTTGMVSLPDSGNILAMNAAFTTDSASVAFKNAPYAFAYYDSLNTPVTGNFSLADSALFVVDFRTNISGFYRILPGLWNALNAVIADSSYAPMRTVFVPDTTGRQKASVVAFHYKGFIESDMENFAERPGFGKYRLYFPPGVSETALRNELQAAGVEFAQ